MPTNTLFMTGLLCVWYAISATANPRYRNQWGRSVISSSDLRPLAAGSARRSQHIAPQAAPWNPRIAAGPRIEATKPVSGLPVTGRPGATPLPRRLLRGRPAVVLRPVDVPARMVETVLDPGKGRGG